MNNLRIEDVYWIAGFLEGEGYFGIVRTCILVQASQVEKAPIDKLHTLLGGSVCYYKQKPSNDKWSDYYRWSVYGEHAEFLIRLIYPIMSPKRQKKIKAMLDFYEKKSGRSFAFSGRKTCRSGRHPWTKENTFVNSSGDITCRICDRERKNNWQRERRAIDKELKQINEFKQKG